MKNAAFGNKPLWDRSETRTPHRPLIRPQSGLDPGFTEFNPALIRVQSHLKSGLNPA
jgi:hypothetical protein